MTSTPVSLKDESLNGSWIDINSASQLNSPTDNDSPEFMKPPHSLADSVQNLGIISFQVERFLQEVQRNNNIDQDNGIGNNSSQQPIVDNISDLYLSDSDLSNESLQVNKSMMESLRRNHKKQWQSQVSVDHRDASINQSYTGLLGEKLSKSGECLLDQVSDSLSMLSRASLSIDNRQHCFNIDAANLEDFDWLWDWTEQPEYFSGNEWKVSFPQQEDLMIKRRSNFNDNQSGSHHRNGKNFSGDVISLLFLTNILSIILGAGITYSVLMRRSAT